MKIGITLKLFLAFFSTILLVVVIMALAVRYSFYYGFLDYINRVEVERLDFLATRIADEYEKNGDWKFVKFKRGMWHRLILSHLRAHNDEPSELPIPGDAEPEQSLDLTDLGLRLSLLDYDKSFVAGNRQYDSQSNAVLKPIISQGKTIGWLSILPSTELMDTIDIQFKEQQYNTAFIIGIISIFFAAGIAVLLSSSFLSPIRRLVTAMRELIAGKYSTRTTVTNIDEIGQLQKDFNSLANTLEKNEKSRHQWIADISHELRTPMSILLGEVEALQDGVRQLNSHSVKSLHTEITRVNQLIEDLYHLSMSDIGALDYRKSELELTEILDDVLSAFNDKLRSKNIRSIVSIKDCSPIKILADSQRLYQLFSNLMQNTLRYTNPNGQFEIKCECDDAYVTVHWHDSEPGVEDHLIDLLFERLFRAEESRSRASGGAGLGLSLCKNIAEAHDGQITVQHSPLGGLWFQVKLPILSVKASSRVEQKLKQA
jgi:two-component system sensor histidine kinase BaeS